VDYFGTQPQHNNRNLHLKQILTPYEYDGSNTVIYMVTKQLLAEDWTTREHKGVLWGKDSAYSADLLQSLVSQVSSHIPIKTTQVKKPGYYPMKNVNITNLGLLSHEKYLRLLSGSKYLLGVGLPLVGPTALEAIAHGAVFINPVFDPPKPTGKARTSYAYTSQHPFVEQYIPEPYAYTIDINNHSAVERVILELATRPSEDFKGYIHPSHTPLGYVQNVFDIFSSMLSPVAKAARCDLTESIVAPGQKSRSAPKKHPGNKVYPDFISFVKDNCGDPTRCRQRLRLPSLQTYTLLDRFVSDKELAAKYAEALYDPGIDIQDDNDIWQKMGKRRTPDLSMYNTSIK
jgi:hypothetical protein